MSAFKKGDTVLFDGQEVTVLERFKGGKTRKPAGWMNSGGYRSKPCTYLLSNGIRVKGSTIKKHSKPPTP